jgi:hypothetical protein
MRPRSLLYLLTPGFAVLFASGFALGSAHAVRNSLPPGGYLTACLHTDGSSWSCPDTSRRTAASANVKAGATMLDTGQITGGTLTVNTKAGRVEYTFNEPFDAIFLTKPAVRKVLVGYYVRSRQFEKAAKVRGRIAQMP